MVSELIDWLVAAQSWLAAGVLVILWGLESIVPMFRGRTRRLSHDAANLAVAVLNTIMLSALAFALVAATDRAAAADFGLLRLVSLPAWAQWLGAILLFDCWQYWWHRANHRLRFLWRFHSMHHADAEMNVTTAARFHPVELLFSTVARLAVLPLLGMTMPQLVLYEALAMPVILFHHSNLAIPRRADAWLRSLIVTPWMHVVHHSRLQPETDSNYSSFLSVWDRLFGSFRLRERPVEVTLGLDGYVEREWRRFPGMLLAPLRRGIG